MGTAGAAGGQHGAGAALQPLQYAHESISWCVYLTSLSLCLQEQRRARHAQLAGSVAAEQAQRCTFRPNVAGEMAAIETLLAQDDSWLSD